MSDQTSAQWVSSADLPVGDYQVVACAELDEVEGFEMIVAEHDAEGAPISWAVLRADPDRVRVPLQRQPNGLRSVRFSEATSTIVETTNGSGGARQITAFGFEDGRYIVFDRERLGPIKPGWTIRHRPGGPARAGRFDMRDATLARARRVFDRPQRYLTRKRDLCTVRFRRGATIDAITLGLAPRRPCASSLSVTRVRLSAQGWHTTRGLRVGDGLSRLERLYPGAYAEPDYSGGRDEGRQVLHDADVGFGRFGTVVAIVGSGAVLAFELSWPNAGE